MVDECDADFDDMAYALTEAHSHGVYTAIIDPDPANPGKSKVPKHTRKILREIFSQVGIVGIKTNPEVWMKSILADRKGRLPRSRERRQAEMLQAAQAIVREQTGNPFIGISSPNKAAAVCMSIYGQALAAKQFRELQELVPVEFAITA